MKCSLSLLGTLLAILLPRIQASRVVIGVDGGTESIRACCFDAQNGNVIGKSCAVPYPTYHPKPGWAEQDPEDWYENLGQAVRGAVESLKGGEDIIAICVDTTCCSVVALDSDYQPLRRSLLWMDARSAPQTEEILTKCNGDPALAVNCGGEGPLSAEWMTPKSLWIRQNEPEVWEAAKTICEYQDYINYKLTGAMCASSCNAASRWHWDGEECLRDGPGHPGRPLSMYQTLGIPELATKLPQKCLAMGALVGRLTPQAAKHLKLPIGLAVVQGGPDAFVGMIGLSCIQAGQLCLITGSSHLHCVVSSQATTAPGTWGAYRGAPLPGINFAEGGQSSTGSILRWAKNLFGANLDYKDLDEEASGIPPGCDGLVALETFQGSRTPETDPLARGALVGLTLSHTRAHIWRALMEAVCFGTRACVEGLERAGHKCEEIVIAGGATRSHMWLQMHADATGKRVVVCENADAPLLGCAILASVGAGVYNSVEEAVKSMVRTSRKIEPDKEAAKIYTDLFEQIYSKMGPATKPIVRAIASFRGGGVKQDDDVARNDDHGLIISPSLLASDWSNIRAEIERCMKAGVPHLHVDVFDGVFLDSPYALTFGPQMVKAIRKCCDDYKLKAVLDLHVCVDRPARYVRAMAESGGSRFIFQWEAMDAQGDKAHLNSAIDLAMNVINAGMKCGVSINPRTGVEVIYPLLDTGLVDLVDILAVEPGFGGQAFQDSVLSKVRDLVKWRLDRQADLTLLVDGGINSETAPLVIEAGADILVAGSFLFRHPKGLKRGVHELMASTSRYKVSPSKSPRILHHLFAPF
jgi:ribulose-phosphate 3-epimerase